jgi:hydroxymethylpyrimidine/phosphomethylpyrimidine kinase
MELNQDYLQKLPEIRELGAFVELQREYSESLWKGMQQDLKARGEILREAVEGTGGVFRSAFTSAAEEGQKAADAVSEAAAA